MNKFSIFFAKHSQKLAFLCTAAACSLTFYIQPYYEVLCRWSVTKFHMEWEEKPSERIQRLTKEVYSHFNMTDYQRSQLDIFLTSVDEPLVLGSLHSPGYAFIGLPYFFGYENSFEIPLDSLDFYRPYFPYGPFTKIGQERIDLMILPESALRFLIAREIVRLQGVTLTGQKIPMSARGQSLLTANSIIGSLYLSYQTIYLLNRTIKLPLRMSPASRVLVYTLIPLFSLFFQYQILLTWRKHHCLLVDQIVCSLGESFRQGGLQYYDWRLRWNRFWAKRQEEFEEIKRLAKTSDNLSETPVYIDVTQHQLENEAPIGKSSVPTDYYLPESRNNQPSPLIITNHLMRDSQSDAFCLRGNRFNKSGNELWAGDGDGINLGLTGILAAGLLPQFMSSFLALFSAPATSGQRYKQLTTLKVGKVN
ncbi:hypothetical protein MN116_008661 [Schistosoma mekongi]|uniref:Transmembrane protein n=1 Tax=Schistosoma mekongi TaxID=38744 RepID=A0AAE1Z5V8_SCHME|nr:hypothetical protein MN116_008661 [Schistosoma mekongi]